MRVPRRWYRHDDGLLYPFPPISGGSPLAIPPSIGRVLETNLTAAARAGTTVTAGSTAHTKGAWASVIDPTALPSYGIFISVYGIQGLNIRTSYLLDIGFGVTGGGGTIQIALPDLDCWGAALVATSDGMGKQWFFPVYIPTGVRVQARSQAVIVSDTCVLAVWLCQKPLYPFIVSRWKSYGTVSSTSNGTPVTPASGAFGSWTEIPAATTTVRAHTLWSVGYGGNSDTTTASADVLVEIGHGPDSANVKSIGQFRFQQASSEKIFGPEPSFPIYHPVPSGQQLWARIASAETEVRSVTIYAGDA